MSAEVRAVTNLGGSDHWTEETDFTANTLPTETIGLEVVDGTAPIVLTVVAGGVERELTIAQTGSPTLAHITSITSLDSGTLTKLRCWYPKGT